MSHSTTPKPVVIFVHGTFAANESDERLEGEADRWWQANSRFAVDLNDILAGSVQIGTDNKQLGIEREFTAAFHWSGQNSEIARRAAGALLLEKLQILEDHSIPYYVIGHSHGGNVIWNALQSAARKSARPVLPGLKGWITVGTPFLHFIPNLGSLAGLLLLPALGVTLWRQRQWAADFWNGVLVSTGWPWWAKASSSLTIVAGAIFLSAMLLHLCYRSFCLHQAQQDPRPNSEIPATEFTRFLSSLKWTSISLLTAGLFLLVLRRWCNESPMDSLRSVFADPSIWLANFYSFLGLIFVVMLVLLPTFGFIVACIGSLKHKRSLRSAWTEVGSRYSCLLAPHLDEAFLGLRALVPGLQGPLLPRIRAAGSQYFGSVHGRLNAPELKDPGFWRLVFSIPREWLVAPVYNNVFAPLLDSYVLKRLTQSAQGADVPALALGAVTPLPLPLPAKDRKFVRLRERFARLFEPSLPTSIAAAWQGPMAKTCQELDEFTQANAGRLLSLLRKDLCVDSPTAISIRDVPRNAMQGGTDAGFLVHTSYFDNADVKQAVARCINPQPGANVDPNLSKWFEEALRPPPAAEAARFAWPPRGMGWWLLRGLVLLLLASSFGWLLGMVGKLALYPFSREAGLAWAIEIAHPTLDAVQEKGNLDQQPLARRTARFVRWRVGLEALQRDETLERFRSSLKPWCTEAELLQIDAIVAQKLIELGETKDGRELLESVTLRLQDPSLAADAQGIARRIQIEQCLQSVIALHPQIGIRLPEGYTFARTAPSFTIDVDAKLLAMLTSDDGVGSEVVAESSDLNKTAQQFAAAALQACPLRYDNYRVILSQLLARVGKYKQQSGEETFAILMTLLSLRSVCLFHQDFEGAANLLSACEELCEDMAELKGLDGLPAYDAVVNAWVLLAKTCRGPGEVHRSVNVYLAKANAVARSSPPQLVAAMDGLIAGAYARLGLFLMARTLAERAPTAERVRVAKEILADEYERRRLESVVTLSDEITIRRRVQAAFNEQNDPLRKQIGFPQ